MFMILCSNVDCRPTVQTKTEHLQLHYKEACSTVVPGSKHSACTPVAIGIEHVNDYTLI